MYNKILLVVISIIVCLGLFLMGMGGICKSCRDKALAQCDAEKNLYAAQSSQAQATILIETTRKTPSERRKALRRWVVPQKP